MKEILDTARQIDCLIKDAKHDAKQAIDAEDEITAGVYAHCAQEKLNEMQRKHTEIASKIEQYKREHGEAPKGMPEMYEYIHERHKADAQEAQDLLAQFKKK